MRSVQANRMKSRELSPKSLKYTVGSGSATTRLVDARAARSTSSTRSGSLP